MSPFVLKMGEDSELRSESGPSFRGHVRKLQVLICGNGIRKITYLGQKIVLRLWTNSYVMSIINGHCSIFKTVTFLHLTDPYFTLKMVFCFFCFATTITMFFFLFFFFFFLGGGGVALIIFGVVFSLIYQFNWPMHILRVSDQSLPRFDYQLSSISTAPSGLVSRLIFLSNAGN